MGIPPTSLKFPHISFPIDLMLSLQSAPCDKKCHLKIPSPWRITPLNEMTASPSPCHHSTVSPLPKLNQGA